MKTLSHILGAILLATVLCHPAGAAWEDDLITLVRSDHPDTTEAMLQNILGASPSWEEVTSRLRAIRFDPPAARGALAADSLECIDGEIRPFVYYVPPGYQPSTPAPLLVYLHGGVSRGELISPAEYIENLPADNDYFGLAESRDWLALFPLGQNGATWWDNVGMANVRSQIRWMKRRFNVEDDRVYLTGFSDGASGSYGFAMLMPDDFAAFVPLCGHLGVADQVGEFQTYLPNLSNSPVYAINTDGDPLYPAAKMVRTVELAAQAGAGIRFKEYEGFGHDLDYLPFEIPAIQRFLTRHPRDPFPSNLYWESADPATGSCRWFRILKDNASDAADWHRDYNMILTDERITFGFMTDNAYKDEGIRVDRLADGEHPARQAGLEAGNVILACNEMPTPDPDALAEFKETASRGDPFTMLVERGGRRLLLEGRFPPPENEFLFHRQSPSAAARVRVLGNRVMVEGSRLSSCSLRIHPDMFQMDQPVVVEVDGAVVFGDLVQPDLEYLLRNFLGERDRRLLYVAELTIWMEP